MPSSLFLDKIVVIRHISIDFVCVMAYIVDMVETKETETMMNATKKQMTGMVRRATDTFVTVFGKDGSYYVSITKVAAYRLIDGAGQNDIDVRLYREDDYSAVYLEAAE